MKSRNVITLRLFHDFFEFTKTNLIYKPSKFHVKANFNISIRKRLNYYLINMALKTLVIGASLKEERYSNKAIKKLRNFKHPVVAIGLRKGTVEDVDIEKEKVLFEDVNTVTLYLNPKRQEEYYNYIISLKPQRVIFNPGTENEDFYKLLNAEKIAFEEACTLVLLSTGQYE